MAEVTVNTSTEPRMRFHEIRIRGTAIISGDITTEYKDNLIIVGVGNTGLSIKFVDKGDEYSMYGDFKPEGRMDPGFVHPLKALKILSYSIQHLKDFLTNSEIIDVKKINRFEAVTNEVFAHFLIKLFHAGEHPELIKLEEGEFGPVVTINLKTLLVLEDDDRLLTTIKTFSDRAEGMKFNAMIPV
jgi:hypothetical protein